MADFYFGSSRLSNAKQLLAGHLWTSHDASLLLFHLRNLDGRRSRILHTVIVDSRRNSRPRCKQHSSHPFISLASRRFSLFFSFFLTRGRHLQSRSSLVVLALANSMPNNFHQLVLMCSFPNFTTHSVW